MTTRCKMRIDEVGFVMSSKRRMNHDGTVHRLPNGAEVWDPMPAVSLKATPVYGNGDPNSENTRFWQSTPNGQLSLSVINKEAMLSLGVETVEDLTGRELYVDLTLVPKP